MALKRTCGRCGRWIDSGTTCACLSGDKGARDKDYDLNRRDKASKHFYDSKAWKKARAKALDLDGGIDVYLWCTDGVMVPADTVHHIAPLRSAPAARLSMDNLMSLSANTHGEIEKLYAEKGENVMGNMLSEMLKAYRADPQGVCKKYSGRS